VERLADINAKIDNVEKLEAVVTAIRGIAAARAQEARGLLVGVESYARVVAAAIGEALRLPHGEEERGAPDRRGEVVFVAEQGFAGAFSDRVLDTAADALSDATVLIVGTRGTTIAVERGIEADWATTMATQISDVPAVADRLASALYERIERLGLTRIGLTFAHPATGGGFAVERQSLLPLDLGQFVPGESGYPPLVNLPPMVLIRQLVDEYVYARLCAAATLAFAAENEARLAAMISARTNVQTTLADLRNQASQARQEEVTEEVIALSASAAAVTAPAK
jgi:F-type H+-transporting ATPase subunit gamma